MLLDYTGRSRFLPLPCLADWGTPIITAPVLQLSGIYSGDYLGTVSYSIGTGTPVALGDSGESELQHELFIGSSTLPSKRSDSDPQSPNPEHSPCWFSAASGCRDLQAAATFAASAIIPQAIFRR